MNPVPSKGRCWAAVRWSDWLGIVELRTHICDLHTPKQRNESLPSGSAAAQLFLAHPLVSDEVLQTITVDLAERRLIDQSLRQHDFTVLEQAHVICDLKVLVESGWACI